jgi:hypothetical protein
MVGEFDGGAAGKADVVWIFPVLKQIVMKGNDGIR